MTDVRARTDSGARKGYLLRGWALMIALLSAALLTSSCGSEFFVVGTPIITFTSKPGRFSSYIITIDAIELTRKDGTIVELPTVNERIDLAHLSSYINLLEVPALGIGTYVSATVVFDYTSSISDGAITVESNGQAWPVVTLLDASTVAEPTTATMSVYFDPDHPLEITSQNSTEIEFNVDLEASNSIWQDPNNNGAFQVTVQPFWNATTSPIYDKPVYARGLYVIANTKENNFIMNVRPLHDVLNQPFGALTVNVNPNTYYRINGNSYVGAQGLAAIAGLQNAYADLQIAAYSAAGSDPFGNVNCPTTEKCITPTFNADQVYVGTSLESTAEDAITGIVTGIDNATNTVGVMNAALVSRLGLYGFAQYVPVTVSSSTLWSQDGAGPVPQSSLGIGQIVTVQGVVTYDVSGVNPQSLDATGVLTAGISPEVRLQNTTLYGTVNSSTAGSTSLTVQSWDYFQPDFIYFSGNGNGAATAADTAIANNYVVDTASATGTTTPPTAGSVVRVDGFANPLTTTTTATPPYFNATSVTQPTEQTLVLEWSGAGSTNPFSTVNGDGIIVNLQDPALLSGIRVVNTIRPMVCGQSYTACTLPSAFDLLNQPNQSFLTIQFSHPSPNADPSSTLYGIGGLKVGEWLFTDSAEYANRIQLTINSAAPVTKLTASGTYDEATGTFTADHITINSIAKETT